MFGKGFLPLPSFSVSSLPRQTLQGGGADYLNEGNSTLAGGKIKKELKCVIFIR